MWPNFSSVDPATLMSQPPEEGSGEGSGEFTQESARYLSVDEIAEGLRQPNVPAMVIDELSLPNIRPEIQERLANDREFAINALGKTGNRNLLQYLQVENLNEFLDLIDEFDFERQANIWPGNNYEVVPSNIREEYIEYITSLDASSSATTVRENAEDLASSLSTSTSEVPGDGSDEGNGGTLEIEGSGEGSGETGELITPDNPDAQYAYSESLNEAQLAILSSGTQYLGRSYDTAPDGNDGSSSTNPNMSESGSLTYRVLDNVTGEVKEVDKMPMVCTDFVVQTFADAGYETFKNLIKSDNQYEVRRTREIETILANSDEFIERRLNIGYKFEEGLEETFVAQVGDIITTTNLDDGGKHIGIVAAVDENGFPTEMMHSSGASGVARTPFLNTRRLDSTDGGNRYDGFFGRNTRIDYQFSPRSIDSIS